MRARFVLALGIAGAAFGAEAGEPAPPPAPPPPAAVQPPIEGPRLLLQLKDGTWVSVDPRTLRPAPPPLQRPGPVGSVEGPLDRNRAAEYEARQPAKPPEAPADRQP